MVAVISNQRSVITSGGNLGKINPAIINYICIFFKLLTILTEIFYKIKD